VAEASAATPLRGIGCQAFAGKPWSGWSHIILVSDLEEASAASLCKIRPLAFAESIGR
jgi:hypothetical protein